MLDCRQRYLHYLEGFEKVIQFGYLSLMRITQHEIEGNRGAFEVDLSSSAARLNEILGFTQGNYGAALPHDHIYGLLGLVGIEMLPSALKPDYNKPYAQVCQDYARFIFESTGDLSLLVRLDSKISGVPSWVPDFRSDNSLWGPKGTEKNLSPLSFSDDGNRMTMPALELGSCIHVWVPRQK
jgi:hypothetical protein